MTVPAGVGVLSGDSSCWGCGVLRRETVPAGVGVLSGERQLLLGFGYSQVRDSSCWGWGTVK